MRQVDALIQEVKNNRKLQNRQPPKVVAVAWEVFVYKRF